jgi:hypothetical protein
MATQLDAKTFVGVRQLTLVFIGLGYTRITSEHPDVRPRTPNPKTQNPKPDGATPMTKLVLAAVAALSLLASPVFAGPRDWTTPTQYNGYNAHDGFNGDFQLQGR